MNDTNKTRSVSSGVDRLTPRATLGSSSHPEAPRRPALLYVSPKMAQLEALIKKYAARDSPVSISGESGVGKELVAQLLHRYSPRHRERLYTLNCGAVSSDLFCAELFGAERGAYTGADHRRIGLLESAHKSSAFLDEIGELLLADQPKLLRFLQEREVQRIGASRPTKVDVRIITATNRDLPTMVEQGWFRRDLFGRLNVLHIDVPSLRERSEDIELLLSHFLRQRDIEEALGQVLLPSALKFLQAYPWPGNVRELESFAERIRAHREPGQLFDRAAVEALLDRPTELRAAAAPPRSVVSAAHQHKRRPGPKPKLIEMSRVAGWLAEGVAITQICQNLGLSKSRFYARPEIRDLLRSSGRSL